MRAREKGILIGRMAPGPLNKISDVPGVRVGHYTLDTEKYKTGVTVVLPCPDSPYDRPLTAASFVFNGFGKTTGLLQVDELGSLETPVALTGTLNVGLVHDALVEYTIRQSPQPVKTVNPLVCECNDSGLSFSADRPVKKEHVFAAIESAGADFAEGDVGAGKGLRCHGLKGGIGSASRIVKLEGAGKSPQEEARQGGVPSQGPSPGEALPEASYTLGVLIQTNHGSLPDLCLAGLPAGRKIAARLQAEGEDKGSVIVVAATDAPLSDRQLRRVLKRAVTGLARAGSYFGSGSGDVFVGFSTCAANRIPREGPALRMVQLLAEDQLDLFFRAMAEATEEALVNSLLAAGPVTGFDGRRVRSLPEFI
ncbi:MAG: P1 family peptidase [Peptococcaceae bacterium]|nr:P1 family peptidase [Peptococcaceae bacterium]